jgi:hypothetical protein
VTDLTGAIARLKMIRDDPTTPTNTAADIDQVLVEDLDVRDEDRLEAATAEAEALEERLLADLRRRADEARANLQEAVKDVCPGDHAVRQHRDRKPPWCPACGRGDDGRRHKEIET